MQFSHGLVRFKYENNWVITGTIVMLLIIISSWFKLGNIIIVMVEETNAVCQLETKKGKSCVEVQHFADLPLLTFEPWPSSGSLVLPVVKKRTLL